MCNWCQRFFAGKHTEHTKRELSIYMYNRCQSGPFYEQVHALTHVFRQSLKATDVFGSLNVTHLNYFTSVKAMYFLKLLEDMNCLNNVSGHESI